MERCIQSGGAGGTDRIFLLEDFSLRTFIARGQVDLCDLRLVPHKFRDFRRARCARLTNRQWGQKRQHNQTRCDTPAAEKVGGPPHPESVAQPAATRPVLSV